MRTVLVLVADANGLPVVGASVKVDDKPHAQEGVTDLGGFCPLQVSEIPQSHLWITALGYQDYASHLELPPTNVQIRVGVGADPNRVGDLILPPLQPLRPPCPVPVSAGHYLLDQVTGQRLCLNGVDQFKALRMKIDGVDLGPLIAESQANNVKMWRIFCQGSFLKNNTMDLWPQREGGAYWNNMEALNDELNQAGILPLWTVFIDNQDIKLGAGHWMSVHDCVAPFQKLVSGGNEWSKNGFDPTTLPVPPLSTPVWSRGSNVTEPAEPVDPFGATFMEFHPRRDYPKVLDDTVASVNNLQLTRGWHVPLVVDEPPRMGTDGSGPPFADPDVCFELGAGYRVRCAGAVFHSRAGQGGVLMDALTLDCLKAWSHGLGAL